MSLYPRKCSNINHIAQILMMVSIVSLSSIASLAQLILAFNFFHSSTLKILISLFAIKNRLNRSVC